MSERINRRELMKKSLLVSAGATMAAHEGRGATDAGQVAVQVKPGSKDTLACGQIGDLKISRILLGGNLLNHFTHSRDLKYVYNLTAHYNTDERIFETMALAEEHGINTVSCHNPPGIVSKLKEYRRTYGSKMQWIICPYMTPIRKDVEKYSDEVKELVDEGCDAIYHFGAESDYILSRKGNVDLIAKAVEIAKEHGVPSGVGAHDINVVIECEKAKVPADFYILTLHHHNYPSAPREDELKDSHSEIPGYWCKNPQETIKVMKTVEKPWVAFKVMAAGAIPPSDAFMYAFGNGADHILAGMFDFEIAEDVMIAKKVISETNRSRPWRS